MDHCCCDQLLYHSCDVLLQRVKLGSDSLSSQVHAGFAAAAAALITSCFCCYPHQLLLLSSPAASAALITSCFCSHHQLLLLLSSPAASAATVDLSKTLLIPCATQLPAVTTISDTRAYCVCDCHAMVRVHMLGI